MEVLDLAEGKEFNGRFWLRDQLCGAAMSIQANIAEGNGRSTPMDYAAFLDRARASAFETDAWLLAAADKALISRDAQERLSQNIDDISAMLFAMMRSLRAKSALESRATAR